MKWKLQDLNRMTSLIIGTLYRHVTKLPWRHDMTSWRHFVTCKTIAGANQHINLIPNLFPGFYYMGRSLSHFTTCCRRPLTSWHDVMTSWRHFVTCKTIAGANQQINLIPNLFPGFYYICRSMSHFTTWCRQPLTSSHDVMTSWRHFVTCKTISGANQHINLIPNLFPGFYYMGRSLSHFTTCCRRPLTSWHDVMTSWRHFVTCKTIAGANQQINLIPNLFPGFYYICRSMSHFTTCCRQPLTSSHDVMTSWRHFVTCKTISGANQHINLIPNLFPGFYYMGRSLSHFTTCCRRPLTSWHDVMTSWRHFVTCKTIAGANQHINLIPNSFPGFHYMGRSLSHFTACCRQPLTSWHDVMTSFRDMQNNLRR